MVRIVWIAGLVLAAVAAPLRAADPAAPRGATREQIERWIKELDSEKFIVRDLATEGLLAAGKPAIEPMMASLPAASLEASNRVTHVLKAMALSGEGETEDAAETALKAVAAGKGVSARRANTALATLEQTRQTRAHGELRRLGAKFMEAPVQIALNVRQEVPSVEIGDSWTGGERGLINLKWATDVNQVILSGDKITDGFLKPLQSLPANVTVLKLKRTKITDAAPTHLAKVPTLQQITILYTPLTDKAVEGLSGIKNLTDIRLYGTGLTEAGAAKLAAGMPGTNIDFRRGAFVGVACDSMSPDCLVQSVVPNGAAEKGGVEPGDIIVGYGGEEVTNFDSFRVLIQKHAAGQKVEIDLLREGEKIKRTLQLGEWE